MKHIVQPRFYQNLLQHGERTAAIDGDNQITYAQLDGLCQRFAARMHNSAVERQLVLLKAHNSLATLVAYLSCLQQGHVVVLLDADIQHDKLTQLSECYQAHCLIEHDDIQPLHQCPLPLADKLALLLSTSGSTGSPKQVCLSGDNLQANAESICAYLPIQADDRTITTLPFCYSYGLSVINSHLLAGACIVFCRDSLVSREFWQEFKHQQISSFAGVPHSYEMLLKLRFTRMELPHLRYFTQAGGRLAPEAVSQLAEFAHASGKQFFVMYGQTEATARMAYVPSEQVLHKPACIGRAIPGGHFSLRDAEGQTIDANQQSGELIYNGANVMLGYATGAGDLAEFCPLNELATGDLAYRDADGDYVISGRLKRFVKINGLRINLDEVEGMLRQQGLECYCLGDDTSLQLVLIKPSGQGGKSEQDNQQSKQIQMALSAQLHIHFQSIQVTELSQLRLTANGKADYPALAKLMAQAGN